MKKIVRLTETELKNVIKKVLLEGATPRVTGIYYSIINAVSGTGTDKTKLLNAFNSLQTKKEFAQLYYMFKDRRTGYANIQDMINQEFDRFDYEDAMQLKKILKSKGVNSYFEVRENGLGQKLFWEGFDFIDKSKFPQWLKISEHQSKINQKCKTDSIKELNNAIVYWRKWLSNPITQQKFIKIHKEDKTFLDIMFKDYFNALNKIKPYFYDDKTGLVTIQDTEGSIYEYDFSKSSSAFAFVFDDRTTVFVNCSLNDPNIFGTMVHEIQHILYDIYPINPNAKIGDVFVKPGSTLFNPEQIEQNSNNKKEIPGKLTSHINVEKSTKDVSKELSLDYTKSKKIVSFWKKEVEEQLKRDDPGYICRQTEKMSNIQGLRALLKIEPGQNITVQMLKPYVTFDDYDTNIYWFLLCWAANGFKNLQEIVNKTNELALQDFKKNQGNERIV